MTFLKTGYIVFYLCLIFIYLSWIIGNSPVILANSKFAYLRNLMFCSLFQSNIFDFLTQRWGKSEETQGTFFYSPYGISFSLTRIQSLCPSGFSPRKIYSKDFLTKAGKGRERAISISFTHSIES